ncbi:MAG: phage tail assembly protein [Methylotenera sp.]|nr:phage tail assembly protein [Methylotenera sp.]
MKITLTKSITAHGEPITEIELREPTGREVQDIGFPYLVLMNDDTEAIQIQAKAVGKYVSKLAGIPPSSVDQMSAADLSACTGVVMSFFGVQAAV